MPSTLCGLMHSRPALKRFPPRGAASSAWRRYVAALLLLSALWGCRKAYIPPAHFGPNGPPASQNPADPPAPTLKAIAEQELAYSSDILAPLSALQRKLYRELSARSLAAIFEPPVKIGDYCYYSRLESGARYPVYFRRPCGPAHLKSGGPFAQEEVLLDLNSAGWGQPELELGLLRISPNQQRMAFTLKNSATQSASLCIVNLNDRTSKEVLAADITACEWSNDNQRLYYITAANSRPYRLYRHDSPPLGKGPNACSQDPELLYEESNPAAWLSLSRSEDGDFLLVNSSTQTTSDVYFIDLSRGANEEKLQKVQPRKEGVFYRAHPHGPDWLIHTNQRAPNYQVIRRPRDAFQGSKEVILASGSEGRIIEDIMVFNDFVVLFERQDGLPSLRAINLRNLKSFDIFSIDKPCKISKALGGDYHANLLLYSTSCWTMPRAIYEFDLAKRHELLLHQDQFTELPQNRLTDFVTRRLFAPSSGGARVPISLIMKGGLPLDGSHPLLLHVYGAYGFSCDPAFSPHLFSLLERGVIYAVAHVRGGGELGPLWHQEGRLLKKHNSIADFLAAAEFLIAENYTSPTRLAAHGQSAGGLIAAAAANFKPRLFQAMALEAPFLDVVGAMLDTNLPSTLREYEEWGNPQDIETKRYMESYSPLANIRRQTYPFILVNHGLFDNVIPFSHTLRWVHLLRSRKSDKRPVVLRVSLSGRHDGEPHLYDRLAERAWQYAFLLNALGVEG